MKKNWYFTINETTCCLVIKSDKYGYFPIYIDQSKRNEISLFNWYVSKNKNNFYAATKITENKKRRTVYLHRLIMNECDQKIHIDHINNNTLDNRVNNLRGCTVNENNKNRRKQITNKTGYKGVYYHKRDKIYTASICVNGKRIHLGNFKDPIEASKKYDEAARTLHKEFANTNR